MCDVLSNRLHEFSTYLSALFDLDNEIPFIESGRYICNIDFSEFHPFFWGSHKPISNFSDKVRYSLFENYASNASKSNMQFVFSRATIFEILTSIYNEVLNLNNMRNDQKKMIAHQREIEKFLTANGETSSQAYASRIEYYFNLLPNSHNSTNIDVTIELLRQGHLNSFYDVFGVEEISNLRPKINKLANEIRPNFYQRPSSERSDIAMRELAKEVDCRNIAISAIIGQEFKDYLTPFVCAPYRVSHETYSRVRRNHFLPSFWIDAIKSVGSVSDAKIIVERMRSEAEICTKWLHKYKEKSYDDVPDEATRDIGHFLISYIDPLEDVKISKTEINIEMMKARVASNNSSTKQFNDAVEEKEEEFLRKAKDLIKSFKADDDLLAESGIEDNPRAKEILDTLGLT